MKRPRLIFVEWLDAAWLGNVFKQKKKLKAKGCHLETAGFLIKETKRGLFIAVDSDPKQRQRARGVSFIPKDMIVRKRKFKVK